MRQFNLLSKQKFKKNFGLIMLFFLVAGCESKSQIIKLDIGNGVHSILKGPVEEMKFLAYNAISENGKIKKGKLAKYRKNGAWGGEYFFNIEGKIIRTLSYEEGSKLAKYYSEYKYDARGNLIRRIDYDSPIEKNEVIKIEYDYDSKNWNSEIRYFERSYCKTKTWAITSREIRGRNTNGDLIKYRDSTFYNYDCNDVKKTIEIGTYQYKYENSLKIEDNNFTYSYDTQGNLIKRKYIDDVGYWEYHPNGIIKKQYISAGNIDEFNEEGYRIKSIVAARRGDVYSFEYKNEDQYGNWTQKIVYEDGKPYLIGERKITYYE